MKKICFLNYGCSAHYDEFRRIFKNLESVYSLTNLPHKADVIIQYFCAISQKDAVHDLFYELMYVSKLKKKGAILIACGCAVDVVGKDFFSKLDFVDFSVGSKNMLSEISKILHFKCLNQYYFSDYDISFSIDIVDGCFKKNGWCSFCKQHYMRRPVKSMPMDDICNLARKVTSTSSVSVISLAGLNTSNYGIDIGDKKPKLHLLIRKLSKIPTVRFIELYSLTVNCMYEELIAEISSNPKVILVELGIQSGSPAMHKIMNTGSTMEQIQMLLDSFSHKAINSIVVVSHPGETREYLQETIDFIEKNNLWYLIVSDYQNSEGTPAYLMEQLEENEYNYHYQAVSETVKKLKQKFLGGLIGKTIPGYVFSYSYNTDDDVGMIYVKAKDFVGNITVEIPDFSSSHYKPLIENVEFGAMVHVKVTGILDFENVNLLAEDLEVIE